MFVYKAENTITGKIYIGQTVQSMEIRISHHFCMNRTYFDKALRKYGRDAFDFSVIDTAASREELSEKERYWIRFFDCMVPNGYNLTSGGEGGFERHSSTRQKMSESAKAWHNSPEGKKRRRTQADKRKGCALSEETKAKLSKALIGKPLSEETKQKLKGRAPWNKGKKGIGAGRKFSDEHKRKISESNIATKKQNRAAMENAGIMYINPMKGAKRPDLSERNRANAGTVHSLETRQKMSNSHKNNPKVRVALMKARQARMARAGSVLS